MARDWLAWLIPTASAAPTTTDLELIEFLGGGQANTRTAAEAAMLLEQVDTPPPETANDAPAAARKTQGDDQR